MQFKGRLNMKVKEDKVESLWESVKGVLPPALLELLAGDNTATRNNLKQI
jgi:hypothetical protein